MSAIETVRRSLRVSCEGECQSYPEDGWESYPACNRQECVHFQALAALDSLAAPPVPEDVAEALALIDRAFCEGGSEDTMDESCHGWPELCDTCPMGNAVRARALATITTALHSLTAEVERLRGERDAACGRCSAGPNGDNSCQIMWRGRDPFTADDYCSRFTAVAARTPERT